LVFDRVFVYYPSDRWIESTGHLTPLAKDRYRQELLYWINKGVFVPVVKGGYPLDDDIGHVRLALDGPTNQFRAQLQRERAKTEDQWVILARNATARGRDDAVRTIRDLGGAVAVSQALSVTVDPSALPTLAYHYAGGDGQPRPSTSRNSWHIRK
jgi:hypothetical protein